MTDREYFTQAEAEALVGKRITTRVAWSGVPRWTTGEVIQADKGYQGWTVAIQWDLPRDPLQVGAGHVAGEPFLMVSGGKPLVDWFSRNEYLETLEELPDD